MTTHVNLSTEHKRVETAWCKWIFKLFYHKFFTVFNFSALQTPGLGKLQYNKIAMYTKQINPMGAWLGFITSLVKQSL